MAKSKVQKKILEYPGVKKNHYYIYSDGEVEIIDTGKKKKTYKSGNGYYYHSLYTGKDQKTISVAVHRLVALNFLPRTDEDIIHERLFVHIKNFNRKKVDVSNLVWVNGSELRILTDMYYDNPRNTKDFADYICKLLEKNYDPEEICDILGLPRQRWCPIIAKIYKKQIYKDITKKYRFR